MFSYKLIQPRMNVKVVIGGKTVTGIVLHEMEESGLEPTWWVECAYPDGSKYAELFYEKELIKWNFTNTVKKCTCGAETCKSPGHAYHCQLIEGNGS